MDPTRAERSRDSDTGAAPPRTLGGKLIEPHGQGHFTMDSMGTDEFPELLWEILGSE